MGIYTLDSDFSSLNGKKADNWILRFRSMAGDAFAGQGNRPRLLGCLLILEQCVHTLRHGLSVNGRQPSAILSEALDVLWGCLEERAAIKDFEDFSNNVYASTLFHYAGEELTDGQEEFYRKHFGNEKLCSFEWQMLTWASGLLMELTAIKGSRVDFEKIKGYEQISFADIDDLLGFLTDAGISLLRIPLPSCSGTDYSKAVEQVYQTELFRGIIRHIQSSLKTALAAAPEQYGALRAEYQSYTIIPEEYSADLVGLP